MLDHGNNEYDFRSATLLVFSPSGVLVVIGLKFSLNECVEAFKDKFFVVLPKGALFLCANRASFASSTFFLNISSLRLLNPPNGFLFGEGF